MPDTKYTETEALLLALSDGESDLLWNYLNENFLVGELHALRRACRALSWTANDVITSKERNTGKEPS